MNSAALHGFHHAGDRTTFVFSPSLYGIPAVAQVALTGDFRDWSLEHEHGRWQLHPDPTDGLWKLVVWNPDFSRIPLGAQFKFLVNEGGWIMPLRVVPNQFLNNFVFFGERPEPKLTAEIVHATGIRLHFTSLERSLHPADYTLMAHSGAIIPVAEVLPEGSRGAWLIPVQPIDYKRVHYVVLRGEYEWRAAFCRFDGWWRGLYSPLPLGAIPGATSTTFRVFAPRATAVNIYLYADYQQSTKSSASHALLEEPSGTWAITLPGNLTGTWYDFTVHGPDEPGSFYYEQVPVHLSDPYARANAEAWGRSLVCPPEAPVAPFAARPAMQEVIAYEVHTEDFTLGLPVPEAEKGAFVAFGKKGLKNENGFPAGLDHLLALGINTVHLLPVQEFLHYPETIWRQTFENDPFMTKQGVSEAYYEWGYRTSHALAIENRYRRKGDPFGAERTQFRQLVETLHAEGLAVIVDIVPNHTAENMDGKPGKGGYVMHWNAFDSLYYYRWLAPELELTVNEDLSTLPARMAAAFVMYGEYGNEVKFEDRPMVQRWLTDQCRMLTDQFGVDGFRVDLGGQVDKQTLRKLRQALGPDIILYGEPWIGSYDPEFEANPDWDWYKFDAPLTWFNDGARNAFKGGTGTPADPLHDRGYAGGKADERESVILGLSKGFYEDYTPVSSINYLDIHDNWTLADQFATENLDGRLGVDENRVKIAATLLLTSPGPVVIHGGTEILRSKGLAALKETVKLLPHPQFPGQGLVEVHFHGKRDTYNMRAANRFLWEAVGRTRADSPCDYTGMLAFWQGLIALRTSETGRLFRLAAHPEATHYTWFGAAHVLGYLLDNQFMVILNIGTHPEAVTTPVLASGTWQLIATEQEVDLGGITEATPLAGGQVHTTDIPGAGIRIWVRHS